MKAVLVLNLGKLRIGIGWAHFSKHSDFAICEIWSLTSWQEHDYKCQKEKFGLEMFVNKTGEVRNLGYCTTIYTVI